MKYIPNERIKEIIDYDPDTGIFTWKARDRDSFKTSRAHSVFNARCAGKTAGTLNKYIGYVAIKIEGTLYYGHRLAWVMAYNRQPESFIDHINGNRSDNRISNLREASRWDNATNRGIIKSNTSGHTGVYWSKSANKWQATIKEGGVHKQLGLFISKDDAIECRINAQRRLLYHVNHGNRDAYTK